MAAGDFAELVRRLRAVPANTPSLRAERKRISREVATVERARLLDLAHHLIEAGIARFVAYELVLNHKPTAESIRRSEVEKLGEGMDGWGDIESFASYVAGPAWRVGNISDEAIRDWAHSSDWCWRRAALVSTVPLNSLVNSRGRGDARRTLTVCAMLVDDRHDLVVKALSWALRELAKRDAESVAGFLSTHRAGLAARVVREVNNKLKTGLKNPGGLSGR